MSYRPITDVWILTRPKVKYYGAYPSGFLSRARALLGVGEEDAVLHVCSGKVRDYPYKGFGSNDITFDLSRDTESDYTGNVNKAEDWPTVYYGLDNWDAILADPPYTEDDADHYPPGRENFPNVNTLLRNGLKVLKVGGKIGILHYLWPSPPKNAKEVAIVCVAMGRNNRARYFTVFEKLS